MLELILDFECNAKPDDFSKIFPQYVSKHLWSKFVQCNHRVIRLYNILDKDNQARLERYFRLKLTIMELRGAVEGEIE